MKNKTDKMRRIEAEHGTSLEEIIRGRIENGASWSELAIELEVSRLTLREWGRKLGMRQVIRRTVEFEPAEGGCA